MPAFQPMLFLLGCIGGLLPDVLRIIKGRYRHRFPAYVRYPNFWVGLAFMVLLGGLAAWAFGAPGVIQALTIGYGAPQLVSRVFSQTPDVAPTPRPVEKPPFDLRTWWAS